MKLRCRALLGDEICSARLVDAPSQTSRHDTTTVLELDAGAPLQLPPPHALGAEVIEATPAEWAALAAAGFTLQRG
jgi:hypothetical protein